MLRKSRSEEEPSTGSEKSSKTPVLPERSSTDKMLNILIGGLSLIVLALVISLIVRLNSGSNPDSSAQVSAPDDAGNQIEQPVQVRNKSIRVEVLNGAGVPRLASKMADYLRSKGFDVVKTDNAPHDNFKKSVVQDRIGDIEKARVIASAVGIGDDGILQQKNPQLYLDVTLIVGQDYKTLSFWSGK